jgi:CheY-like chemotaxis protein
MTCTILLVEDNLLIRELVREILEIARYHVIEAVDGNDALRKIEETTPNLILLDIQMPGLDGFGVLRRLRQDARFSRLPVIALTAYAMQSDQEKILGAGFDCYMTKPIDRASLLENIHTLLVSIRLASSKQSSATPLTTNDISSTNYSPR